eukprot:CAMPEP_0117423332 /NCGR_PEP_ID=MMETSP0758-20121206/3982_1 /TAXON_ID=63605 /ORGANISM="Percolomonas cosmopolitus, Strain AE-1 (ATCC 50343)" /LENGTH=891 /DNA_ID=CAMNT_0005206467 /DNA_START=634 /DNA_END=3309 /DNA_ORIENTATION=+
MGINFNNPEEVTGNIAPQHEETTTCTKLELMDYYNNITKKTHSLFNEFQFPGISTDSISTANELHGENLGGFKYDKVDIFARNVPYEYTKSVQSLGEYLCQKYTKAYEKCRAIFVWMTDNISYHGEALMGAETDDTPEGVLHNRRSLCEGYSNLFVALCKAGGIEAKKVHGFAKGAGYKIGENLFSQTNHTWNIVKLYKHWHLIDVTWGAGQVMFINFEKRFTPHYFLPNPKDFIMDHYPEDPTWQLLDPIVSRELFQDLAYCRATAFEMGLEPLNNFAKQAVSIIDYDIAYAFNIKRELDIISLQLTCKSIKNLKVDLKKYTTYLLQPGKFYVYVAPPFRGKYELQIFLKDRKDSSNFTIPLAMTYQIKVRNSRPFDVGYFSYNSTFPMKIRSKVNILQPMQGTLLLHSDVKFQVTTFEEVEMVVVSVGWKPPGAYVAGVNYTIKQSLTELAGNLYESVIKLSPPPKSICHNGTLQCSIYVKPKDGLPMPTDEYGWLHYQMATYDVVPQYPQFDKNYGKTFVLLTKEQEKELKITKKMEVKNMKDAIDHIAENGATTTQGLQNGFKLQQPINPFITLSTGEFCDIQLKTPGGYFISSSITRFSERYHPALVYYDKDLNLATVKVYFSHPGRYLFKFTANKFGENDEIDVCKLFIRVNGEVEKETSKPFLQTLSSSRFMILSERWRSYLFNKHYAFEILVNAKQPFSGLYYPQQQNSPIQSILMEHPDDKHLRIWRGDLFFPQDFPFVHAGLTSEKFLVLTSTILLDDNDIPLFNDTKRVDLGHPDAGINLRKVKKRFINVNEDTYIMQFYMTNEKYQLDVSFCDFSGSDFTQGVHYENNGTKYEIRVRARRAGLHRLKLQYRVPDKSGSNRFSIKKGPVLWLNFNKGALA